MKASHTALPAAIFLLAAMAVEAGTVEVNNAWVRATVPGQVVGAAYMELKSASNVSLVEVLSPAAASVEIHTMTMENNVMQMRQLDKLPLPAGQAVKLEPGGKHLMLIGLKRPLMAGSNVRLTLRFKDDAGKSSQATIEAPVKPGSD